MESKQWVDLQDLPDDVKAGDPDAIAGWLAEQGRERNIEVMVWVDRKETPVKVEAGTSSQLLFPALAG